MNAPPKTRPELFWDYMFEIYGMQWANSYGAAPTGLWVKFIDSVEDFQLKFIVKTLMHTEDKFLPNMTKIIGISKRAHKPPNPNQATLGAEHKEYTPQQCEANRKKLKRIMEATRRGEFRGLDQIQIQEVIKDW